VKDQSFRYLEANAKNERVVVIGKNGFVGSSIISALNQKGITTFNIGREDIDLTSEYAHNFFSSVIKPRDIVIFAAGDVPVKSTEQLNANLNGLDNFIRGIKGINLTQLIYVSSDAVYMDSPNSLSENSICAPETLHGLMHLTREVILQNSLHKNYLCIVRPTLIYGANDPHNGYGPSSFIRLARKNEDIHLFGNGEEKRDFIYISDVANIIVAVVEERVAGVLNLATGEINTFAQIANTILVMLKGKSMIKTKPRVGLMPHNGYRPFDVTNLKLAFPFFIPISIKDGLAIMNQDLSKFSN